MLSLTNSLTYFFGLLILCSIVEAQAPKCKRKKLNWLPSTTLLPSALPGTFVPASPAPVLPITSVTLSPSIAPSVLPLINSPGSPLPSVASPTDIPAISTTSLYPVVSPTNMIPVIPSSTATPMSSSTQYPIISMPSVFPIGMVPVGFRTRFWRRRTRTLFPNPYTASSVMVSPTPTSVNAYPLVTSVPVSTLSSTTTSTTPTVTYASSSSTSMSVTTTSTMTTTTSSTDTPRSTAPISYKMGNPVLTGNLNMYYIYYGAFAPADRTLLEDFGKSIGQSDWIRTNHKYYFQQDATSPRIYANGSISLASTITDAAYSSGRSLQGSAIPDTIQRYIDGGRLPEDTNAVYFFLIDPSVTEKDKNETFCVDYCGYHSSAPMRSGKRIQYALVGNHEKCIDTCAPPANTKVSPNNNVPIDSMVKTIAHELVESITDPYVNVPGKAAWFDTKGEENADKCESVWTFAPAPLPNGARYSNEFGGRKWLINPNWDPARDMCSLSS